MKKYSQAICDWLNLSLIELEHRDCVEIVTPFTTSNNDCISLYVEKEKERKYRITDGGDTIGNLFYYGYSVDTKEEKDRLNCLVRTKGAHIEDSELVVYANDEDFGFQANKLIQIAIGVSYLVY